MGIEYIAWISSSEGVNWYEIETYFIAAYKPPVNDRKKTESPKPQYKKDYSRIKKYFFDNFIWKKLQFFILITNINFGEQLKMVTSVVTTRLQII